MHAEQELEQLLNSSYLHQEGIDRNGQGSKAHQLEDLEAHQQPKSLHVAPLVQHNLGIVCNII